MKYLANIITAIRIPLSLALLFFAPFSFPFIALYILCGLTDMIDGTIARMTHSESEIGGKLDNIADLLFVVIAMVKILPILKMSKWVWLWIIVIIVIKIVNFVFGHVCHNKAVFLHTTANKITGFLLFIFPLTLMHLNICYTAPALCIVATFAAIQEGHFIRTGRAS